MECNICASTNQKSWSHWINTRQSGFPNIQSGRVLSRVWLFATPWTVAHQAPLSMGLFRQEHWSGWPFPPPEHLPDSGIELASAVCPTLQVDSLLSSHGGNPKVDFRVKNIAKDKETHFVMRKVSIHQRNVILSNYAANNRDLKCRKPNLIELRKEIEWNSDFSTSSSTICESN